MARWYSVFVATWALVALGCEATGNPTSDGEVDTTDEADGWEMDTGGNGDAIEDAVEEDGWPDVPLGWIGSPCNDESDCDYSGAVCVEEFPLGMCSLECDLYCPDRDGYTMTFCVDDDSLPAEAVVFVEGACFSRCDYGLSPGTGCREGYGCVLAPRANEPGTEQYTCIPGEIPDPLPPCLEQLAELGVSFEPTVHTPTSPDGHPELLCTIEDPVLVHPPIHGVDLDTPWGETPGMLMSCVAALALVATVDDVATYGVTRISHMGTYSCRVISGTDSLSQHAHANAIDLAGFEFADGAYYTLTDDWEHDTTTPSTPGGTFLYEAAYRWYDKWIWNIILTPNYNAAHDDHFHVDMSPSSHFIELVPWAGTGHWIGPAPYDD